MKKLIVILAMMVGMSYAQAPEVRTYPASRDGQFVIGTARTSPAESHSNGLLVGGAAGTMQNGTVVSLEGYDGAVLLWFLGDTTGASVDAAQQSDSCLSVYMALKNNEIGVWGGLYSETTTNYTLLDTIDRAYINVAGTVAPYMVLADEDAWAHADSVRFMFQIGTSDSLYIKVVMQGF